MLGKAMKEFRKDFFICSRTQSRDYESEEKDLTTCMEMLQTDYIDIYQIHQLNNEEDLARVLRDDGVAPLLQKAKEDGRIRFTGVSSHHLDAGQSSGHWPFRHTGYPLQPS